MRFSCALLVLAAGCGHIEYGRSTPAQVAIVQAPATVLAAPQAPMGPPPSFVAPPPRFAAPAPVTPRDPNVVYVPWDPGAYPEPPPRPPVVVAPPQPAPRPFAGRATVTCSGHERIRVDDRVVAGNGGPAIVATGNCVLEVTESILRGGHGPALIASGNVVVEVSESIIRGEPAIIVRDQARVQLRGSRIQGDMSAPHPSQITSSRSRHERGQMLQGTF